MILLRPKANIAGMDGNLSYASGGSGVQFRYEVVRLWQQPVEPFLHGGVSLLPLAPLCQMPADQPLEDALRNVVREIDRRLANECEHAQAARLMTAAYILTGLRVKRGNLGTIYDGVRIMHESSAFELIEEEATIKVQHKNVLRLGRKRLGDPDEATLAALKTISDLDRLERLIDATMSAATWDELLATP